MNRERQGFHISHVYSLWQDLSHHTLIFELVTLTYFSETLTMNHERQGFHISHVYSLWQDLLHHTIIFYLLTLNF